MDAGKQAMIDKVMKLLELGKNDSGEFTPEQQLANEMAAKLMAKHALDFGDLREKKEFTFERQRVAPLDERYCAWESTLASCIAEAFDCQVIINKPRYEAWYLNFLGTKTDNEVAVFFYRHLRRTIGRKAEIEWRLKRDQETYAFGMVDTISQRLMDLYKRRNDMMDAQSSALVVVKSDGLSNYVKEQFPRLKKGRAKRLNGSMEAYNNGQRDGKKVGLSRPIQSNGTPVHRID